MKVSTTLSLLCWFALPLISQNDALNFGGGAFHHEAHQCISAEARTELKALLKNNLQELEQQGLINPARSNVNTQFIWPIRQAEGFNYNSVYGISFFVDMDGSDGEMDHNCQSRTYNGHRGTDIFLWPFQWHMVDNEQVEVVAAAPGMIFAKQTGNESYNCEWAPGLTWNAIFLLHEDNSTSWYGHMKEGTLTDKGIGDMVEAGEYLGVVASSGYSTGAHLHFEAYDSQGNLIDPYSGNCNNLNSESYWVEQKPYREPMINTILTHSDIPTFTDCQDADDPVDNFSTTCFMEGQTVYFAAYYHDQEVQSVSDYKVYRPDGTLEWEWSQTSPNTFSASWWWWSRSLPPVGSRGEWTYSVTFNNETFNHSFYVGNEAAISSSTGVFTACEGESLLLTSNSGSSYNWSNGASTQSIEVSSTGTYAVTVITEGGCELAASQVVSITSHPVIAGISGAETTVPGLAEVYQVAAQSGSSYVWSITGGAQISGGNTASIEVEWDEVESGQICVTETDLNGCSSMQVCKEITLMLTSTHTIEEVERAVVWPNPSSTFLMVELDFREAVAQGQLTLHNAIGAEVAVIPFQNVAAGKWQHQLDVSNFSAGVYWLSVQVKDQLLSKKVLIF